MLRNLLKSATLVVYGSILMKSFCAALFVAALSLGGCCLSGSGCYAPQTASQTSWDGLGQPPEENAAAAAPKPPLSKAAGDRGDQPKPASDGRKKSASWQDDDAQLQSDDASVKRKLIICHGCAVRGD